LLFDQLSNAISLSKAMMPLDKTVSFLASTLIMNTPSIPCLFPFP